VVTGIQSQPKNTQVAKFKLTSRPITSETYVREGSTQVQSDQNLNVNSATDVNSNNEDSGAGVFNVQIGRSERHILSQERPSTVNGGQRTGQTGFGQRRYTAVQSYGTLQSPMGSPTAGQDRYFATVSGYKDKMYRAKSVSYADRRLQSGNPSQVSRRQSGNGTFGSKPVK